MAVRPLVVCALVCAALILPLPTLLFAQSERGNITGIVEDSSSLQLDVRVEAFNIFNRVVWSAPSTNFSSNSFGVISGQDNQPRRMQLGLKLYW